MGISLSGVYLCRSGLRYCIRIIAGDQPVANIPDEAEPMYVHGCELCLADLLGDLYLRSCESALHLAIDPENR